MKINKFDDIDAWKEARKLVGMVYNTIKSNEEFKRDYRLVGQIQGASVSTMSNACPVKQLKETVYYTYVLQSDKDEKFYVGFTKDLKLRFEQHTKGLVESTRGRRPLRLIYYEACLDRTDATRREKYLKTYHGKMFLKRRFKSYLTG